MSQSAPNQDQQRATLEGLRNVAEMPRRGQVSLLLVAASAAITTFHLASASQVVLALVLIIGSGVGIVGSYWVRPGWWRVAAVVSGIALSLVATLAFPDGLAEIIAFVGAVRLPFVTDDLRLRNVLIAAGSVATAVVILVVSANVAGLLAGLGFWALADRSAEHIALQAERDRAVALAAEIEASRDNRAEAAASEERNRIAQEMHDVLAHTLAGLSVQLQGLRAVAAKEGASPSITGPLNKAADLARDGVAEARSVVGALRNPVPRGMDQLQGLIKGYPGDGEIRVSGSPRDLGNRTGHAVYRAIQESLTNAARYATGSQVLVMVDWQAEQLAVTVTDNGLPEGGRVSGITGNGSGLSSMSQRLTEVGGRVFSGPRRDGPGWQVEIFVPLRPSTVSGGDQDRMAL